jgi:hypothetical protein
MGTLAITCVVKIAEAMAALRGDKEAWLQGPSAVVAVPAACLVNTGPYRGTTLFSILLTGPSAIKMLT